MSELGFQIDLNAKLLTRSGKYLEVDEFAAFILSATASEAVNI
ncbi:hypothetical protein [Caldisphaera sp.]